MLTIDSTKQVDRSYFESKMTQTGYIYVDALKFKNSCSKFEALAAHKEGELVFKMQLYHKTHSKFLENNKDNVILILSHLGAPLGKLEDSRTGKISLDMERKVKPLLLGLKNGTEKCLGDRDKLIDFLETFVDYKQTLSKSNGARKKLVSNFEISDEYNKFGKRLSKIHFEINQRVTGRYYTSNDNIQGYALNYVKAFSVPKGRLLVSVDFAQIDLRVAENMFLKDKSNAEIFDSCEDKYEALVRAIDEQAGRQFNLEEFKANRPAYKEMALACMYGSKSMSGRMGDAKIVSILEQFYAQCDKLNAVKFIGKSLWLKEQDVMIEDYFGYIRDITFDDVMAERGRTKEDKIESMMSKIVNTPVQTTSASIMPIVTLAILDKFKELGYSEDDVRIYMNRHDEIVFDIDEKVMKDSWVFKDYEKIYIDDWDELRLEVEFYDYYKEVNDEYMKMYEESWKTKLGENLEHETPKGITKRKAASYNPLGKMFCILNVSENTPKFIFNKFCFSVDVLKSLNLNGISYADDLRNSEEVKEFIRKNYPNFWEAYEKSIKFSGETIIVDINRSLVSKTMSTKDINSMVSALGSDVTYVYLFGGEKVEGSNIICRSKAVIDGMNLFELIDSFCAKENAFYRINRDVISGAFI